MKNQPAPVLNDEDDMFTPINVDYNALIHDLMADREISPVLRSPTYALTKSSLSTELPKDTMPIDEVIKEVRPVIDKYCRRNGHPGYFGFLTSSGSQADPLGHAMAACVNQNVVGFINSPAGTAIERTVINWLINLVGIPAEFADGVMLTGGSMANFTALSVALANHLGPEYRQKGLLGYQGGIQPSIICSSAAHFSIQRAASLIGIGSNRVIEVKVDSDYRMSLPALEESLISNQNTFCVVATAGTTIVGSIDPLLEIAELCKRHNVWLHVDAAYGGGVLMSEELRHLLNGIEQADSITIDLHKWYYCTFDISVLLYRDKSAAETLFFDSSNYFQTIRNDPPEGHEFFHLAPELSRRFRALPVYITLRHYGTDRLGNNVRHNVQCAQYLAHLVENEPDLAIIQWPQLSVVTFRYVPKYADEKVVDSLNSMLCDNLKQEGNFYLSPTKINGRPILRVAILSCSTRSHHIRAFVKDVLRIGRQIIKILSKSKM